MQVESPPFCLNYEEEKGETLIVACCCEIWPKRGSFSRGEGPVSRIFPPRESRRPSLDRQITNRFRLYWYLLLKFDDDIDKLPPPPFSPLLSPLSLSLSVCESTLFRVWTLGSVHFLGIVGSCYIRNDVAAAVVVVSLLLLSEIAALSYDVVAAHIFLRCTTTTCS